MAAFEDVRSGLALRLTSNYVAQSSESKALQVWTQQLTQSSKLSWCSLVLVRVTLALLMLIVLMWDNVVYFLGTEQLRLAFGGHGGLNSVLLPLCTYLIFGVIITISMSFGGRGHFKIAHPRMLTAHALLASVAFPTSMLTFVLYWLVDFRNRNNTVPFLESQNGERVVALGHTLGLFTSLVDVIFVEQALFLGDIVYPIVFGVFYLVIMHIGVGSMSGVKMITEGGPEVQYSLWTDDGLPSQILINEVVMVFVVLPLCYVFFWLIARDRGQRLLRNSKDKDVRDQMRQRDTMLQRATLVPQAVPGNPFDP